MAQSHWVLAIVNGAKPLGIGYWKLGIEKQELLPAQSMDNTQ